MHQIPSLKGRWNHLVVCFRGFFFSLESKVLFLNAGRHRDKNRLLRNNENTLLVEDKSFVEEMETEFLFKTGLS